MKQVFKINPYRGSVIVHLDHSKLGRERRKLRAMIRLIARHGKFTINDLLLHYQGWRHYTIERGSYGVVKQMDAYVRELIRFRPDFRSFCQLNKFDGIDPKLLEKFIV